MARPGPRKRHLPTHVDVLVGGRLRQLREQQGFTQQELCAELEALSHQRFSQAMVSLVEQGRAQLWRSSSGRPRFEAPS